MANGTEAGVMVEKEPVYVDESLIWKAGMGVAPGEGVPITPPEAAEGVIPLIVDIETTGTNPWESRIICIGYKNPAEPDSLPTVILNEDEKQLLLEFLSKFVSGGYNQVIGFNVAFDYRFIFARCLYYRIECKEWADAALYDIMEVMQQVKLAYVFGMNKSGTLENWMQFLLGMGKMLTIEELLAAWELKEYPIVTEYNMNDVQAEFLLYALIEICKQNPFSGASFATYGPVAKEAEESFGPSSVQTSPGSSLGSWKASCPNCYATAQVPASQETYFCKICGTPITR